MVCVSGRARPVSVSFAVGLCAAATATALALATPAEARKRHHRGKAQHHRVTVARAYNPPYADIVVDVKTGRVLHAVNEDALRHPASITKVMTLYLLFEQLEKGRMSLDTPLRVSAHAAARPPSKLGLRPGQTIAVEDAIKALVTKSANDAAATIAENVAGSEEAFAGMMTRKARALGMSRTVYRNASGLPDPEQVTTARDLAILARAVQERFPRHYRYFQTRVFHYAGRAIPNHNRLLGKVEGVDGIKTGFTRASGFNLMTSARTDDRHIVAIVLGGRSGASRDQKMAALVGSHLPRAYAGLRTAPAVAEAAERPRPAVVAEAPRPVAARTRLAAADGAIETTGTASATPRFRGDVTMRPAVSAGDTTTPNPLRWLTGPSGQALPSAAQAYAATGPAPLSPPREAPLSSPTGKIEARLPTGTIALPDQPDAPEPAKAAAPEAKRDIAADTRRETNHRPSASPWVIQLGAMDDEDKAKTILSEARVRSGRVLAHASPFTEKVVHDGTTLYRARFSGFQESDAAQQACKTLKRSGFNCFATRS